MSLFGTPREREKERREYARLMERAERGDHRHRCEARDHLICEGCGECACINSSDFPGDWEVRVVTDKDGDSLCKECRYETKTAAWLQ